jgi:septal ring factor EnvC (AmiA/AmiB activator)
MRRQWNRAAFGTRALWVAAAVLAATWNLGILVALSLQEEPDRTTRANQEMDSGASELRRSTLRDQAARMERDLAAMGRNVEPQTATVTRTVDEASPAKQQADAATADLRKSLQQEHERASKLEQDLATARRDIETQAALVAKAGAKASEFKKTADGPADLRKSLQQKHERASKLEQDLAAARRDVETQTALAAKAGEEASQLKKAADGSADLRKSLQQEHERASKLEQELAAARRDVETQTALAAKAGEEASQLKKAADGSADLRKSLQQEHERASKLEQELAAARRDVETQTALAVKAGEEAAQLKQVAEKGSAEQRQSLQQERDKAEALKEELSTVRSKIYAYEAQARQASDQAAELKQAAESGTADLQKSLQQEHERASKLEQDLAAARGDVETQTALAGKANAEAARLKQVTDSDLAELKRSLRQEHDRAEALAQELSTAHTAIYAYEAQARMANDQSLKQAADGSAAELGNPLVQEWEREARLQQDLAAARRDIETQTALATKAGAEASQLKQTADAGTADLRKALQEEHDRSSRLEQDLTAAQRDVERQTALAGKANAEAARLRQAAESGPAELLKSLQQERDSMAWLERDVALARSKENALAPVVTATDQINAQSKEEPTRPVLAEQAIVADARPDAPPIIDEDGDEIARLVARANVLLGRGDIGSARIVLQRAAEMGDAQASFTLAQTYDPQILFKWGTYGTRGDATRALDLYARALAGGIMEAKERSDALRR